jgi:ABC-type dipeptide/oligopeptide/nickel transport system permease component
MLNYTIRSLLFAIPMLLVISFIIFAILDLAPNDPTGNLPLTIPLEVREKIRMSLGLGEPFCIRFHQCAAGHHARRCEFSGDYAVAGIVAGAGHFADSIEY